MQYSKMTKQALVQEIEALKAQLYHTSFFAAQEIDKASRDNMMGSAVILKLESLSGKPIIEPTAMKNGLSKATIEALKADLKYTQEMAKDLSL